MFGESPVRLLVKLPVPLPSIVLLFAVVGFEVELQQTPLAVTVAPPSEVTFPPHEQQPNVIDGGNAVENPMAPCVVGVFTVILDAGISFQN